MRKISWLSMLLGIIAVLPVWAQDAFWPKEIPLKTGGKILIFQPQPDALEGNLLRGRAAIGAKEKMNDPMVYGAIFFDANLNTDRDTRMATLESLKITNAKLADVTDGEKLKKLSNFIEGEVPKWNLDISLDQVVITINRNIKDGSMYNNTPPKMYYRNKPTTLVILDGEPIVKKDKDIDAERVLNSPNLIFKDGGQWMMYSGGIWYKSSSITSGWVQERNMSKKVASLNEQIKKQEKEANNGKAPTEKPVVTDILVSTVPAELLQTEGAPAYKPIEGTSLQYATNTKNDILKTADGTIFVLIAGRWYKSASLEGPWTFNGSDKLPPDFSKIPEGSPKDNVLVSVSGTAAADEAIIDAEIPQTAKVDRKTAKAEVEYDGNPKFERIEGTSLELAENSNITVIKDATGTYHLLDNGIWFNSRNAKGPWTVSDKRPEGVDAIPPSSPAFNARFVHIYESTPEYVVVGYTSGYLGTFVQGDPTIIFGTGFYYRPWFGSLYYPRPCTWGFNFCYNPWTGWTIGYGFNVGFMHIGFTFGGGYGYGYGYGGWFGPPYYRPPYRPPYYGGGYYGRPGGGNNININTGGGDINIGGSHNNIYNRPGNSGNNNSRPGVSTRPKKDYNKSTASYNPGGGSVSKPTAKPANVQKPATKPSVPERPSAKPSTNNPNNVFTDKDGNVFQRDNKGNINQRDNKSNTWTPANNHPSTREINNAASQRDRSMNRPTTMPKPAAKPAPPKPATRPPAKMPASRPAPKGRVG